MYKVFGSVVAVGLTGYATIQARLQFPTEFLLEDTKDQIHRFWLEKGLFRDRLEVCTQSRVNECLELKCLGSMNTRQCKVYNSFWPIQVNLIRHKDDQALRNAMNQAYNEILTDRRPPFFEPVDPTDFDLMPRWEKPHPKHVAEALQKVIDKFGNS
jgi:hypothetical protein